jgi:hypothetical protein
MKIFTTLQYQWSEPESRYVLDASESYSYTGPVALACGATGAENTQATDTTNAYNTAQQQAASIFGASNTAFQELSKSYTPIVAAGPGQQGFSQQELSNLNSSAITQTGVEAKNEKEALGNSEATAAGTGGSGPVGPGGATIGANLGLAENAGNQTASELSQIQQADYAQGATNYQNAVSGLSNATSVFNPATSATSAATGAGESASTAINNVAQSAASPWQMAAGAIGSVAGAALGGGSLGKLVTGGNATNAPVSLSAYNNASWTPGSNTSTPQNS